MSSFNVYSYTGGVASTALGTELDDKMLQQPVGKMLIGPFIKAYNKKNGTKFEEPANVFNIAINGSALPQTVEAIMTFPCKTLVNVNAPVTELTFNLETRVRVKVSSGETYTDVALETKNLKDTIWSSVVSGFLDYYNKVNRTKKGKSDIRGLVIDGETPTNKLASLLSSKLHSVIRDPRHAEIRILMSSM